MGNYSKSKSDAISFFYSDKYKNEALKNEAVTILMEKLLVIKEQRDNLMEESKKKHIENLKKLSDFTLGTLPLERYNISDTAAIFSLFKSISKSQFLDTEIYETAFKIENERWMEEKTLIEELYIKKIEKIEYEYNSSNSDSI